MSVLTFDDKGPKFPIISEFEVNLILSHPRNKIWVIWWTLDQL